MSYPSRKNAHISRRRGRRGRPSASERSNVNMSLSPYETLLDIVVNPTVDSQNQRVPDTGRDQSSLNNSCYYVFDSAAQYGSDVMSTADLAWQDSFSSSFASFDGIEIPWNILNPPCNDFPCNDLFFNDLAQPFPRVPQLSSSLNSDLWMEYQTATYNTNFSTDVSYPQDQSCTSLFNNDLSAIQEPLYSSSGLNQQCLSINDLNSSLYTSVVLPTQTQYHWIDSQVLPICDADRSPMDNISLNDQVFLQDMHDTLEIPSSVGPDRITQDNRRSTRVQKKPYEKQIIRKKAVEDRVIDESKVLAPTSPEIGVSSMSLQKPPTKWESRHGFASPDGSWIIVTESEGIKHVPFDKVRPVAAKPGNMYRCRWEQCRYLVFATLSHMRAHMRNTHNIGGNMGIKCQWHPPIRVLIPGYDEPVLTTNHQLSYACNAELHSSSLFNHIDSHLNFERQANPNVIECTSCGDGKVRRGSHRCKGSMSRKNRTK